MSTEEVKETTEAPQVEAPVQEEKPTAPRQLVEKEGDNIVKVNLDELAKVEENAIQERETKEVSLGERTEDSEKVDEGVRVKPSEEASEPEKNDGDGSNESPIEQISEPDEVREQSLQVEKDETTDSDKTGVEQLDEKSDSDQKQEEIPQVLPENVEKLVKFLDETGGSVEDWVNLNKNIDELNNIDVLREYYKQTKPHLNHDEVSFLLEEEFYYDKEEASEREVKKKQLAFKEALYNAKNHLKGTKDKYYSELKFNNKNIPPEYLDAYKNYGEIQEQQKKQDSLSKTFKKKTDGLFNDEFKGFEFKVGDSKYRYKINDVNKTKQYQSDINNFIGDYVGDDGAIKDISGYHKALYAAKNIDKIAEHFYDQGRADAIQQSAKEAKNIDMSPRSPQGEVTTSDGTKFKVVSGDDSSGLKFKIRSN